MGLDIGPATEAAFAERVGQAGTVVWNGPMGVFEFEAFCEGTRAMGRALRVRAVRFHQANGNTGINSIEPR